MSEPPSKLPRPVRSIYTSLRSRPQYVPPSADSVRAAALSPPPPASTAAMKQSTSRGSLVNKSRSASRSNSGLSTPKLPAPTEPKKPEELTVKRVESRESVASYRSYDETPSGSDDYDEDEDSYSDSEGGHYDPFVTEFSKVDEIVEALNARADHLLRLNASEPVPEKPKRERRVDELHQLVDDVQVDSQSHDSILDGIRKRFGLSGTTSGSQSTVSLSEPAKEQSSSSLSDLASIMATTSFDSDFVAKLKRKYLYANEMGQIERQLSLSQESESEIKVETAVKVETPFKNAEIQSEPEIVVDPVILKRNESKDAIIQTDEISAVSNSVSVEVQVETPSKETLISSRNIETTIEEDIPARTESQEADTVDETSESSSLISSMMSSPITTDMIAPQILQIPSSRTTPSITELSDSSEESENLITSSEVMQPNPSDFNNDSGSDASSAESSSVSSAPESDEITQEDLILAEIAKAGNDDNLEFIDDDMLFPDDEILQVLRRRLKQCTSELREINGLLDDAEMQENPV